MWEGLLGLALVAGGLWIAGKVGDAVRDARYERRRSTESALQQAIYCAYWQGWQDKEKGIEGNAERGREASIAHIQDLLYRLS